MKRIMVRYKVKPEFVEKNESLVKEVFHELYEQSPSGIRYASFKAEDGVSFVHIVLLERDDENPLSLMSAFTAFTQDIAQRCDEPPVAVTLDEVGSYEF